MRTLHSELTGTVTGAHDRQGRLTKLTNSRIRSEVDYLTLSEVKKM